MRGDTSWFCTFRPLGSLRLVARTPRSAFPSLRRGLAGIITPLGLASSFKEVSELCFNFPGLTVEGLGLQRLLLGCPIFGRSLIVLAWASSPNKPKIQPAGLKLERACLRLSSRDSHPRSYRLGLVWGEKRLLTLLLTAPSYHCTLFCPKVRF